MRRNVDRNARKTGEEEEGSRGRKKECEKGEVRVRGSHGEPGNLINYISILPSRHIL